MTESQKNLKVFKPSPSLTDIPEISNLTSNASLAMSAANLPPNMENSAQAFAPQNQQQQQSMTIAPAIQSSMKLIESKLERIEKVILAVEKSNIAAAAAAAAAAATTSPAVVPPVLKDSDTNEVGKVSIFEDRDEPAAGETLDLVADSDVSIQDRARMEFGKKLSVLVGLKNLTIKAASSLPPTNTTNNAFSNSYRYNNKDGILMV
jgi:hypothetical protein